ncbi:MAG: T9SS type A sorting domain-containing protein [Bacteroidota bacterium]
MYKIVLTFFLCLILQSAFAQIPNAGFENWTGGNPDGWVSSNINGLVINITQSSTAFEGSSSVRGEVVTIPISGALLEPFVQSGPGGTGFSISQTYVSVTGNYQFSPVGGDRFALDFVLYKGGVNGTGVAVGAAVLGAASGWHSFNVPFAYSTLDIPDWCVLNVSINGPVTGSDYHLGSWMLVDNLAFSNSSAVEGQDNNKPEIFSLNQNYPNPFNPSTTISYSLSKASYVKLRVYNILGKELTTLADGFQSAGNHSAHFLASNMASGVYFYRLEAEGYTAMKQMLLVK